MRMPLRLTLKPHERAILGGAVLTNGKHRTELFVETEVPVLRGGDILSPSMVRTPCERVVLAIQLMYVDPHQRALHHATYRTLADEVLDASPSSGRLLAPIAECVDAGQYYQALKLGRELIAFEKEIVSHVR